MRGRLFLLCLVVGGLLFGTCANLSDTHGSLFDWATNGDHTQYAPGFSEKAFAAVRLGSGHEDVRQLLGEPVLKSGCLGAPASCAGGDAEKEEFWRYTRYDGSTHGRGHGYVVRNVVFVDGQVIATEHEYQAD
jgi:hypothetical protein